MAKILVVDDEFGIGELLREVLSDDDHQIVLAINGRQRLQMIAQEQPDLVFMDFMMPVLNGAGMLKAMMEDPNMAQIPVIIMSSLPEASVAERAHGHVGFIRKPFQINTILDVAAAALAGSCNAGVCGVGVIALRPGSSGRRIQLPTGLRLNPNSRTMSAAVRPA